MPHLEIVSSEGRLECINCGSHTYAKRCGTCEGTALVPVGMLTRAVRNIADRLEAHQPPATGGVAA